MRLRRSRWSTEEHLSLLLCYIVLLLSDTSLTPATDRWICCTRSDLCARNMRAISHASGEKWSSKLIERFRLRAGASSISRGARFRVVFLHQCSLSLSLSLVLSLSLLHERVQRQIDDLDVRLSVSGVCKWSIPRCCTTRKCEFRCSMIYIYRTKLRA